VVAALTAAYVFTAPSTANAPGPRDPILDSTPAIGPPIAATGTVALAEAVLARLGLAGAATLSGSGASLGQAREAFGAQLVGGRVANDARIILENVGSAAVDVYGKAGEFIGVGGPAKAINLSDLGGKLKALAGAAEQAGVKGDALL
jgi:hypothetical protein